MTIARHLAKRVLLTLNPKWAQAVSQHMTYRQMLRGPIAEARTLRLTAKNEGIERAVELAISSKYFWSTQKQGEITALLQFLSDRQIHTVLEIGCRKGGTLYLLAQIAAPRGFLCSLDLSFDPIESRAFQHFRKPYQTIVTVTGNSHEPSTMEMVRKTLGGRAIDLLFIDGDHSYNGVIADYQTYAPLVASGGIIAFHDIVPDYETRFHRKTSAYAGGVPAFWQELKLTQPFVREFIDDPEQDGFGIGVLRWERRHASRENGADVSGDSFYCR